MFGFQKARHDACARLATLNALRTNVMIADNDLNITYMNPSVVNMMKEAEAELLQQLLAFGGDRPVAADEFETRSWQTAPSRSHRFYQRVQTWIHIREQLGETACRLFARARRLSFEQAAVESLSQASGSDELRTGGELQDVEEAQPPAPRTFPACPIGCRRFIEKPQGDTEALHLPERLGIGADQPGGE